MWEDNAYYSSEKMGLKMIDEIEWDDESYSFNLTIILKDAGGNFYWVDDSGCSCPCPFESHAFPDDFTKGTAWDVIHMLEGCLSDKKQQTYYYGKPIAELEDEVAKTIERIRG